MNEKSTNVEEIKDYWSQRAAKYGADQKATLKESKLRELEISTMKRYVARFRPSTVLDLGCGNGYSTNEFGRRFPNTRFLGVDYSEEMLRHVQDPPPNCTFMVGDMLSRETYSSGPFDLILTQRAIQNLPTYDLQKQAIQLMLDYLRPGGRLLLMECSKDGVDGLDRMRRFFGKSALPNPEPFHNLFLRDAKMVNDFGAKIVCFASTYMFLTRVVSKKASRFYKLPNIGRFGYDRLYIVAKPK